MKIKTTLYLLIALSILSILHPITSSAQESPVYMYWADFVANKIQRANLDGSNVQDIVPVGSGRPTGIALDIAGGKMYLTDRNKTDETDPTGRSSIQRANLDGSNIEILVLGGNSVKEYIALDISNGKMYWSEWTHPAIGGDGRIRRANLDGTNVEDIVTGLSWRVRGIALDISQEKIYWTDTEDVSGKIQCANLDGSNIQDVLTVDALHGIALDIAGSKIYWANPNRIRRANLDGSNIEDLVVGLGGPFGIALDISNNKMYWTEPGRNKIQRANLDGTNIEDVVTGLRAPVGIALGIPQALPSDGLRFDPDTIADQTFTVGTYASLNLPIAIGGTEPYDYTLTPDLPTGLQFDSIDRWIGGTPTTPMETTSYTYTATDATGASASLTFTITVQDTPSLTDVYMYWTDPVARKIQRANLDGTNVQNVIKGLDWPEGIALDLSAGKIYWTGWDGPEWRRNGNSKIQRANFNGTNIETLVTGDEFVKSNITLDLTAGKMYWVHWTGEGPGGRRGGNTLQRANLDGSNVETLVRDLYNPRDIALDISRGKIYWTDAGIDAGIDTGGTGKIQRANLDGTNIENVLTGLHTPIDIALDFSGGKMYWTDWYTGKVQCANFDGSNLKDLVLGLDHPVGIALDSSGGKVYWAEFFGSRIRRANLDGSHVEALVTTGLRHPLDITLGIPQTPGLRLNPNVIADQTFVVNTPIQPLYLPLAEGGTQPYTYTLDPTPAGLSFDAGTLVLSGVPTTVGDTIATYTATDATGASVSLTFTITVEVNLDVNADGKVDVLDLVWVAVSYGMRGDALLADVNADGVINIQDLVAVAEAIDAAAVLPAKVAEEVLAAAEAAVAELETVPGAPVIGFNTPPQVAAGITVYGNVAAALADARPLVSGDMRLGKWIPLLERLLQVLAERSAIPETTALLPNYPNPFNPETWIPYHLAQDTAVVLTIYDGRGSVVRTLTLGHQPAGVYVSRGRAAYWDGRNNLGEKVASGLYFYTLTAGDFNATRKLLIAK